MLVQKDSPLKTTVFRSFPAETTCFSLSHYHQGEPILQFWATNSAAELCELLAPFQPRDRGLLLPFVASTNEVVGVGRKQSQAYTHTPIQMTNTIYVYTQHMYTWHVSGIDMHTSWKLDADIGLFPAYSLLPKPESFLKLITSHKKIIQCIL